MWWELSKVHRPTFIAGDVLGDEYQKFLILIAQAHRPNTWGRFYVEKDIKINYASINFSWHLYYMKSLFPLFPKLF